MGNVDIEIFMQRLDAISARRKAMQSELARERHRVGIDKSPEAREVRGYAGKLAGYMRDYVEDVDDPDNEAAQGRVKLDEQMKRLHDLESRLNAQA